MQVDNMAAAADSPCPVLLQMACEGRPAGGGGDVKDWWRTWGGRDGTDADDDVVRLRVVREGWMAEPGPEHLTLKAVSFHCRCPPTRSGPGLARDPTPSTPAPAGPRRGSTCRAVRASHACADWKGRRGRGGALGRGGAV